ncbi:class I SAM-dependent methyltransferase [Candidatus Roizmanbacteria bacterium]|nr:class I SAM-dependent methyltransferase [Candidatus Roizmanbacteria bacterium]
MITQTCAICGKNNFTVLYPENFDIHTINSRTFSARRLPDRIHYRMVKCKDDGLIYSNPILEYDKIEKLYKKSFTAYDEHLENLRETYGFYLKELERYGVNKDRLLEIGCGNGFFLEEALSQGYKEVYGVEPGKKSVEKAKARIKKNIIIDIFKRGQFRKNSFDVICCLQTFDHIPDPNGMLKECYKILKKDGFMLFLNHDAGALTNKLMGEKSPIIDIEHTYLFSKEMMKKIFEKHKFKVLETKSSFNIHHLSYWIHLFPIPNFIKLPLINLLNIAKVGRLKIKMYPGNLVAVAKK